MPRLPSVSVATPTPNPAANIPALAKEARRLGEALDSEFKPAGYLPAPATPRFISAAEEAAKKLPQSIKAESVKNALVKGGAKPVELEYAGLDQFLAGRKGQRISSADVLAHIQREGPLGQMGRVDQQAAPKLDFKSAEGIWGDNLGPGEIDAMWEEAANAATLPDPAPPLADIRKPFDESSAYPATMYHDYTEQGKRGDRSGYREVLFADPRNPGRTMPVGPPFRMQQSGEPVNAHNSDYWIRYHSNPNEIAVQNIQSDIGQRISKDASERPAELRALNQRLDELYALEDRYLSLPDDHPEKADGLKELSETISDAVDYGHDGFRGARGADGRWRFSAYAPDPASPISRDDKWKDFLARQIVLEAAAQGKPISLPTAENANMVERMPTEAARAFYEQDFPGRIRKVLKEFDPQGGGSTSEFVQQAASQPQGPLNLNIPFGVGGRAALTPDVAQAMSDAIREARYTGAGVGPSSAIGDIETAARAYYQHPDSPHFRTRAEYGITGGLDSLVDRLEADAEAFGRLSEQQVEQSRLLGMLYGLLERSPAQPIDFTQQSSAATRRPGTHISMTPVARRNILERGMPILSLAPLLAPLLTAGQEDR